MTVKDHLVPPKRIVLHKMPDQVILLHHLSIFKNTMGDRTAPYSQLRNQYPHYFSFSQSIYCVFVDNNIVKK